MGALDATRGVAKGPDAIIDTRSLAPKAPVTYTYELPARGFEGPFRVEAELMFRAFPAVSGPRLRELRGASRRRAACGPSGPLVTDASARAARVWSSSGACARWCA